MPVPSASSRIYRWFKVVLGAVVTVGVVVAMWHILRRWDGSAVHVKGWPLLLSIFALLIANFFQAFAWMFLLERMSGKAVPIRASMTVFMSGQLARYTPGKVGLPMVRIAGAEKLGLSARLIAASVGIEVASWLGIGAFLGCCSMLCSASSARAIPGVSRNWLWMSLTVISCGLAAALLIHRNRFPKWVLGILRAEGQGPFVSVRVIAMQLLAWSGWWIHGVLVSMSVGSSINVAVEQAAVFILAPIIGFLAMVAPGGLGVRETIISYALAPQIGASAAIAAALLARAAALLSELGGWLISVVSERR